MIDLAGLQKHVYANKIKKGFNVTDINLEFCYVYGELAEAHGAFLKKKPDLGEELADVAIYLLGLAEIFGVDLESELIRKIEINDKRRYAEIDGVNIRLD